MRLGILISICFNRTLENACLEGGLGRDSPGGNTSSSTGSASQNEQSLGAIATPNVTNFSSAVNSEWKRRARSPKTVKNFPALCQLVWS